MTHSTLEIDFFNFEWYVHVFNYFTPERKFYKIDDISYGKENVPVSCVNSLDNNYPEYVEYSTVRLPQKKVDIPLDEGFLTCCDCDDGCQVSLSFISKIFLAVEHDFFIALASTLLP